jgi:aspartate/methionine/tyrosine aminotransferase
MKVEPFDMERWQSLYEHGVELNLSESGVHPLTLAELAEITGVEAGGVRLGYTQTNGTELLRERIAALYPGASPANVLVTCGGAEANYLAIWARVEPGDRVAIVVPTYGQTPGLAPAFGGRVHAIHLEEERGWQPAPGASEAALGGDGSLVVVTNPNNPTGAMLAEPAVEEIVTAAERAGAWILSDEVYAGAEVEGGRTPSLWGRCERVLVTGSLSKAYGLPGLRIGWLVGPATEIERLWSYKDYTTIGPPALSDHLAAAALEPSALETILARTRRIVRANRDLMQGWVEESEGAFRWRPPDAGAIGFLRYEAPVGSTELAESLRVEDDVLVVPGDQFGVDGYLRIGFGIEPEPLRTALGRVAARVRAVGVG